MSPSQVQPQKLGQTVRDGIRNQLLDSTTLQYLETCGAINWNPTVYWQCRRLGTMDGSWEAVDTMTAAHLEEGYSRGPTHWSFSAGFTMFQVDFDAKRLLNSSTNSMYEVRRVAFAPLMPMEVRAPSIP